MRKLLVGAAGLLVIGACDDASEPAATPAPVHYLIPQNTDMHDVTVCYALTVSGPASARFAAGVRYASSTITTATTLAQAQAGGARCAPLDTDVELVADTCDADGAELTADLTVVGIFGGPPAADIANPCPAGEPCRLHHRCTTDVATPTPDVTFELTLMRESRQGFFDISSSLAVEGATDACYALRLDNADGATVGLYGSVCAHDFGVPTGAITFIAACDAERSPNTLHAWITSVANAPADWVNPCPAPSGDSAATWSGGCAITAECPENMDVLVTVPITSE